MPSHPASGAVRWVQPAPGFPTATLASVRMRWRRCEGSLQSNRELELQFHLHSFFFFFSA